MKKFKKSRLSTDSRKLQTLALKYVTNANFSVRLRLSWVKSVDIQLTLNGDFAFTRETLNNRVQVHHITDGYLSEI